jgi:DNA-binding beta-propeller fold protein YncE
MEPSADAVSPNGTVFVADFWNQRIQAFTPGGTFLRSWPVNDWQPQSYDEPYLAVDPSSGNVLATDPQREQVLVYRSDGKLIGTFGSGRLTLPIGVAVQPGGRVAVSDSTANHVLVFKLGAVRQVRIGKPVRHSGPASQRGTPINP